LKTDLNNIDVQDLNRAPSNRSCLTENGECAWLRCIRATHI